MIRTVDLVVAGDGPAARAAAVDVLRCGGHVLVVLRSDDVRRAHQLRHCLRKAAGAESGRLRVMAHSEVVCADGVDRVEAVVVRHLLTGRLSAVNASAFAGFDADSQGRHTKSEQDPLSVQARAQRD